MGLKVIFIVFVVCGVSGGNVIEADPTSFNNAPLIVGGTNALAGEFRAKISIQFTNGTHICGGTLIQASHVLTSASCVTNSWGEVIHPRTYRLMGDDLTINEISGNPNRQLREASHVFVHPEYNLYTYDHNIAVIRTNLPYTISETFGTALRARDSPPVNTVCRVAGWGSLSNDGPISFQLQRVNAVVISRADCNSHNSYSGAIRGGMFCAGIMAGGQGTCQGDDGGGLICNNVVTGEQDVLFGIVSWGVDCALAYFPAVYTDVATYNFWIDSTLEWNEGEHELIPTPTTTTTPAPTTAPTTTTTTTPSPGGAATIVKSMYLFVVCISVVYFK